MKISKLMLSKLLFFLAALLALSILCTQKAAAQETPVLYWGKSGDSVIKVQQRLANWGYYNGPADGFYGAKTLAAIIKFQQYNGLSRDGVVGRDTWTALGFNPPTDTAADTAAAPAVSRGFSNSGQVELLAKVIEGEAADEPFVGKVAVASVIVNRLKSGSFPGTLSSIVYQPAAFESVSNGQYNRPVSDEAIKAARLALNGWDPTGGALFFWNPAKRVSSWIWSRPIITQIGRHVFAR